MKGASAQRRREAEFDHSIIVCGGRAFADRALVFKTLDALDAEHPIYLVTEGGQTGADTLAREWAKSRHKLGLTMWANWKLHGPAAGPKRNAEMLTGTGGPIHYAVAFPGDDGTADLIEQAGRAGVLVLLVLADGSIKRLEPPTPAQGTLPIVSAEW